MIGAIDSTGGESPQMQITSPAFADHAAIPPIYTCDGRDISPPLLFTGVPAAAESLVLIVYDPDAPDPNAPKLTWVHWLLFNLPPHITGLDEHMQTLPDGANAAINDWKRRDYGGPCPPIGRHRYFSNSMRSIRS